MYGIEKAVREIIDDKSKTDSKESDDAIWILDADKNNPSQYILYRPGFHVEGSLMAKDSAFNLSLSPKNMLYRSAGFIAGAVYPYSKNSVLLKYASSERNTGLVESVGSFSQKAREDFKNTWLNPLFLPFLFTFYTMYDVQLISKVKNNPYGYVEFEWEGLVLKGFIYDNVKVFPSIKKEIEWRLIAHPDMDMKTILTRYNEAGRLQSL